MAQGIPVPLADLRKACTGLTHRAESSAQLPRGKSYLGQQRAIDAIRFGLRMDRDGYNIYVLGPAGSHRHGLAQKLAHEQAMERPVPSDWCYVNNFADPEQPQSLRFPPGCGREFVRDMHELIDELQVAIPAAFDSDDYRNQLKVLEALAQEDLERQWKSLRDQASRQAIKVLNTPTGYVLAPIHDGKVVDDEEFEKLPDEERTRIQSAIEQLGAELQDRIEKVPRLRKRHRERVKKLNRDTAAHAIGVLISELVARYEELPKVVGYLQEVQQDITENARDFRETEQPALPFMQQNSARGSGRYDVNLIVDNAERNSAPVVYEPNPSYQNIIGKIEHRAEMGALVTDFRLIRGGALHQANGGYLIIDAQRLLTRPFVWEALKQILLAGSVRIESPGDIYGLVSTTTLRPEPITLDLRIVLIGERWLYYLLGALDSEFNDLFKVAADLADDINRTNENTDNYALLIADRIRERDLLRFTMPAIQRVIEQSARHSEDSERLSMHMRSLDNLLAQADFQARARQSGQVETADVVEAISDGIRRMSRVQSLIADAIERDSLLIDTSGACVGQVNGLSVVSLGEFRFGHPVRITATTRMGTGEGVDIEREVELGGAIHSKGMLILSAALSSRYATNVPLSLHGSVVFEQSYGGVEGDSASVGELCALLSSLSEIPVLQNLAVTGSINQLGRVQAVGGINEKIEGFFDICSRRGLDGTHGVIIPHDNVKNLMLNEEVLEAVRGGTFSVYAVRTIDEAVEALTGVAAGERDSKHQFPADSVNGKVEQRLIDFAIARREFSLNGGSHAERR